MGSMGTVLMLLFYGINHVEPYHKKRQLKYRFNIGQGKAKRAGMCPKSSQLRTRKSQKSEAVSEVEPTSDKEEPKERGCVRRRTNFRQGKAKRARMCPKTNQLQTRQSKRSEAVSEVEPTSDKGKSKKCDDVLRNTKYEQPLFSLIFYYPNF
ncbi:hypothetical protein L1999_27095 [Neobacillus drentensis]|uniref:hypothetical protein n=1 Tax=Neobacillus drentensis TaxID=220684 RepID=UPI001F2F59BF|nr:hypothetical protein [Neobacillus drentensis]ULT56657.1 hypothetical protein L1999_27095 [Neobacillus drentensis]